MEKICNNCKIEKNILEFSRCKRKKDGFNIICKSCFKEKYKKSKEEKNKYYQENKHKWQEYYQDNKDIISEYKKEYRKNNKDKIKESQKIYVEDNKDYLKLKWKEYRENNKEKIEKWFKDNDVYRKEYKKIYTKRADVKNKRNNDRKERKKIDKIFLIKENVRSRISHSIKLLGFSKHSNTEKILGCTYEDVIRLNHFTNLQPLCSYVNRHIKRDSII